MITRRFVTGVLCCTVLAGCGSDDSPTPAAALSPSPVPSAADTPSTAPSSPLSSARPPQAATASPPDRSTLSTPTVAPTGGAPTLVTPPQAFTREPAEQQPSGGPLGVASVRVARQDGFDRVVFELAGRSAGQPGWRVEYVDQPTRDGSGDRVAVQGSSYLQVTLTGVGYPMDSGVPEPTRRRIRPTGTELVREVVLTGVFEGQYVGFVGVDRTSPVRVFRLRDPARVVIDVQHR